MRQFSIVENGRFLLPIFRKYFDNMSMSCPAYWSEFKKIQIGGEDMEGRQPKRRKDKYNPYEIYEKDGKYYVS